MSDNKSDSKSSSKKSGSRHDLIFYANRNTPQVVPKGAAAKPKPSYGKQTSRRAATAEEEKKMRGGKWLRVDKKGRTPSDDNYGTGSKIRPQFNKNYGSKRSGEK